MAHHIGCLETSWSGSSHDKRSVKPILQLITDNFHAKHHYEDCDTVEEFKHHLRDFRKLKSFNLIYIAAHGSPFTLHLAGKNKITIDELEEEMSNGFEGRVLHLGACKSVLSQSESHWKLFMRNTGIVAVSGFSKDVDWMESSALEMLWFAHLQKYEQLGSAIKSFPVRYPDLCQRNKFQIFKR